MSDRKEIGLEIVAVFKKHNVPLDQALSILQSVQANILKARIPAENIID